jgi:protein SCO1/2
MIGLTGSPEQVDAVAKAFRVVYGQNGEGDDYLMSHTVMTYLLLPGVGYVEFYRNDEPPEVIAESVACYASHL